MGSDIDSVTAQWILIRLSPFELLLSVLRRNKKAALLP